MSSFITGNSAFFFNDFSEIGPIEFLNPDNLLVPDAPTDAQSLRTYRWAEVVDAFAHYVLMKTNYRIIAYLEPMKCKGPSLLTFGWC